MPNIDPIDRSSNKTPGKAVDNHSTLRAAKGDIVAGRIIKALSPGQAVLLIDGKHLTAHTSTMLKEGSLAFFRVEEVTPECILRLVEMRHCSQGGSEGYIKGIDVRGFPFRFLFDVLDPVVRSFNGSGKQTPPDAIRRLWDLLSRISLQKKEIPTPEFLKSFLNGSGILWEQKLKALFLSGAKPEAWASTEVEQDLKGLALAMLAEGHTAHLVAPEKMNAFVEALEQFQLMNASSLEEKGRLLLFIPVQWKGGLDVAQLLIDLSDTGTGQKKKDKQGVVRLSLFLNMSELGPVRVDASVHDKNVMIRFEVPSNEVRMLFDKHLDSLTDHIERHGFTVQVVSCRLVERTVLEATSFLNSITDLHDCRISVVV
jgi:hypothetical protein